MELGKSPEIDSPFKSDFSQAMQLFGEAQQSSPRLISGDQYTRAMCIAILAADIAEDKLSFGDANKQLNPEDLELSFEDNKPMSIINIIEKGAKANGSPDFSFVNLIIGGKAVNPDQPAYTRYLRRFLFYRIKNNSPHISRSKEEMLHSLLVDDQSIVIDTTVFNKRS